MGNDLQEEAEGRKEKERSTFKANFHLIHSANTRKSVKKKKTCLSPPAWSSRHHPRNNHYILFQ